MYEFIKDYHDRDMYKNPVAPQPFPVGSGGLYMYILGLYQNDYLKGFSPF